MGVSGSQVNDSVKLAMSAEQAVGTLSEIPKADEALTFATISKFVVSNLENESQDEDCIKDAVERLLESYSEKQHEDKILDGAVKRIKGRRRFWLDLNHPLGNPKHPLSLFACDLPNHSAMPDSSGGTMLVSAPILGPNGPANEIREFKKLLDEGIITEEEFAKAKTNLIARMIIT